MWISRPAYRRWPWEKQTINLCHIHNISDRLVGGKFHVRLALTDKPVFTSRIVVYKCTVTSSGHMPLVKIGTPRLEIGLYGSISKGKRWMNFKTSISIFFKKFDYSDSIKNLNITFFSLKKFEYHIFSFSQYLSVRLSAFQCNFGNEFKNILWRKTSTQSMRILTARWPSLALV